IIDVGPPPQRQAGQSEADFRAENLTWQRQVTMSNWNRIVEQAVMEAAPAGVEIGTRDVLALIDAGERHRLRNMFVADPALLGERLRVDMLASADTDNWLKGTINRDLPDARQQLSAPTRQLADLLLEEGAIEFKFAW